jgi:hypothetical protein
MFSIFCCCYWNTDSFISMNCIHPISHILSTHSIDKLHMWKNNASGNIPPWVMNMPPNEDWKSYIWKIILNYEIQLFIAHSLNTFITPTTNSMEQGPSCKTDNHSAGQEIPQFSWNLKVHYYVHRSSMLVPILSHITPVLTLFLSDPF